MTRKAKIDYNYVAIPTMDGSNAFIADETGQWSPVIEYSFGQENQDIFDAGKLDASRPISKSDSCILGMGDGWQGSKEEMAKRAATESCLGQGAYGVSDETLKKLYGPDKFACVDNLKNKYVKNFIDSHSENPFTYGLCRSVPGIVGDTWKYFKDKQLKQ